MNKNERRAAWTASFSHFFTHGYMTLLPAVLVVVAGEQSLGFFALGALVNLGYFLFGLGSIPAGVMVDRVGPKRVLVLGLFGMAISSILVGIAPERWTFGLAYALLGLSASIYHPAGLSLIARHIEKKGKALSLHGILGNMGLSLAPLFAGLMVMVFDTWRAAYLVFGCLGLIFAIIVLRIEIEGEPKGSFRKASPQPQEYVEVEAKTSVMAITLPVLFLGSILFGFVYRGSLTFFPALFQQYVSFISSSEQPVVMAGIVTSIILSVGVVGQWMGGYLSDRFHMPEKAHIFIYIVVVPVVYLLGRLSDNGLIAAAVIFSLVFYGWQPIQNSLIAKYTARSSHGKGYGLNFFFIMGMGSIATVIGGYVADEQGVDKVYQMLSAVSLVALAVSIAAVMVRGYLIRYSLAIVKDGGSDAEDKP